MKRLSPESGSYRCVECFRKSGNRFSDKKHDKNKQLPEKWEPVFQQEARQKQIAGAWETRMGTDFFASIANLTGRRPQLPWI
jgi:hypothetical protein